MPQKRNPVALYTLRMRASETVAAAEAFLIMSHNVNSAMPDYKRGQLLSPARTLEIAEGDGRSAPESFRWSGHRPSNAQRLRLKSIIPRRPNLLTHCNAKPTYPSRLGHHFASELVTFGRSNHLRPAELPFEKVRQIYADFGKGGRAEPEPAAR